MNRPITFLIIDNDLAARTIIKHFLLLNNQYNVLGDVSNSNDASQLITKEIPDVFFIDTNLPFENGISYVERLIKMGIKSYFVFTSSQTKYAMDAYQLKAFDYLVKPFGMEILQNTLDRIACEIETNRQNNAAPLYWGDIIRNKLEFKTYKAQIFLSKDEILYAKSYGNNVELQLSSGVSEKVYTTISNLYSNIKRFNFFKINRSIIVNLDYVSKIEKKQRYCYLLHNGIEHKFSVSRESIKFLDNISSLKLG